MKQFLAVRGTQEQVASVEVNTDTVYVRTNINRVEEEWFSGWKYDEVQYDLREYQELVANKSDKLQADVDYLAIMTGVEL